jgi:uncharacterized protein YcfJ
MRTVLCIATTFALGASSAAMAYDQGYGYHDRQDTYRGEGAGNVHYAYGEVLDAQPIYRTSHRPADQEVCWEEPVEYRRRGHGSVGGTLVGALIGGVVGSQIGSGGGRRAATAAGTLIGAAAGNDASRRGGYVSRGYEQRCEVRRDWEPAQEIAGYDVTYRYRGEIYQTRTDYQPGDSIRVRVAVDAVP